MDDWENKAREIAEGVAEKAHLLPFLRVLVRNRTFSLENLLFIYEQNPGSKAVCGKRAWEQLGRSVKADAVPIRLVYPDVSAGQGEGFCIVNGYDYDSTEGKEYKERRAPVVFADRITQLTGVTWELVPENVMGEHLGRGFYKKESQVFYMVDTCTESQREQTILELYVDYVIADTGCGDRLVRLAVCFVIYEYFGVKHMIVDVLFARLGKMSQKEKWDFLKAVYFFSQRILDDLEGYKLSFDETAFINQVLVTDNPAEIVIAFEETAAYVSRKYWKATLLFLKEKLLKTREGFLTELCRRKYAKQLFSYPPVALEFRKTEDWMMERRDYGAE